MRQELQPPEMGSGKWCEGVFSTGPARKNKGHAKHTQYHQLWVPAMGTKMGGQGRLETCALLALEYFHTLGFVRRFKEQPFITDGDKFGAAIYPDFLVELPEGALVVIEIKTERFITHALKLQLDRNRDQFAKHNMRYLVWSDKTPLSHSVRHHLIQMRRFASADIPAEEVSGLTNFITTRSIASLNDIYQAGFDLSCLYAACSKGSIFMPLNEPLGAEMKISSWCRDNFLSTFLDCKRSSNEWWESL